MSFLIVACSSNDDYLQAKTLPPISVPESLDSQALGQLYSVPEGDGRLAAGEYQKPLPPTLSVSQAFTKPTIQGFEGKSWLVVPKEASVVWSQLMAFLQVEQFQIGRRDLDSATIETQWFSQGAEPGVIHRYRLHLEPGLQPGFTEVHVLNVKRTSNSEKRAISQWPESSEDVVHESWFLQRMSEVLERQRGLGNSLLARSIIFEPRVFVSSDQGEPVLEFSTSEARAFDALHKAVLQSGLVLYEQSASERVFYFNEDKALKKGKRSLAQKLNDFIGKLSRFEVTKKGEKAQQSPYRIEQLLSHMPPTGSGQSLFLQGSGKPLSQVSGYLLVIRPLGEKQRVYIRDGYGQLLSVTTTKALLDTIKRQLI